MHRSALLLWTSTALTLPPVALLSSHSSEFWTFRLLAQPTIPVTCLLPSTHMTLYTSCTQAWLPLLSYIYAEQQHLAQGWAHAGLPMPAGHCVEGPAALEHESYHRPSMLTHTWVERGCECGLGSTQ